MEQTTNYSEEDKERWNYVVFGVNYATLLYTLVDESCPNVVPHFFQVIWVVNPPGALEGNTTVLLSNVK